MNEKELKEKEAAEVEAKAKADAEAAAAAKTNKSAKKEETVEISKAVLDKILKRMDVLEEAADKNRFERINSLRNPETIKKVVNLATYNSRIVIGWKTLKNDVWFDHENKLHEDQVTAVFFHKGKKDDKGNPESEIEMPLQSFSRLLKRLPCEVVSETKDTKGNITLKVVTKEGEEISVGLDFVNVV